MREYTPGELRAMERQYVKEHRILYALCQDNILTINVDLLSDSCEVLQIDEAVNGLDSLLYSQPKRKFSELLRKYVETMVVEEDKDLVYQAMNPEYLREQFAKKKTFHIQYHARNDMNKQVFWETRFADISENEEECKVILSFRYTDDAVRMVKKQEETIKGLRLDKLTGILNRGSGEIRITDELMSGEPGMFCLFDVNKFKTINDTYGHAVGDDVLKAVAEAVQIPLRDGDVVMRLGGDEFAFVTRHVDTVEKGSIIIDRVFQAINEIEVEEMQGRKIEISLGAVLFGANEYDEFELIYKRADEVMYQGKQYRESHCTFWKKN